MKRAAIVLAIISIHAESGPPPLPEPIEQAAVSVPKGSVRTLVKMRWSDHLPAGVEFRSTDAAEMGACVNGQGVEFGTFITNRSAMILDDGKKRRVVLDLKTNTEAFKSRRWVLVDGVRVPVPGSEKIIKRESK